MARPLFTPRKDLVPTVQEAGWTPGSVWTDVENPPPTGIQSLVLSACSQSLYRLRYLRTSTTSILAHDTWPFALTGTISALTVPTLHLQPHMVTTCLWFFMSYKFWAWRSQISLPLSTCSVQSPFSNWCCMSRTGQDTSHLAVGPRTKVWQ